MTVIELIQKLERIAADYGNQTLIECRNIAGDLDEGVTVGAAQIFRRGFKPGV